MSTTPSQQINAIRRAMIIIKDVEYIDASDYDFIISVLNEAIKTIELTLVLQGHTDKVLDRAELWMPVIDWMHDKSSLNIGDNVSEEVLKRVQEYESLKKEIAELEKRLEGYNSYKVDGKSFTEIAEEMNWKCRELEEQLQFYADKNQNQ